MATPAYLWSYGEYPGVVVAGAAKVNILKYLHCQSNLKWPVRSLARKALPGPAHFLKAQGSPQGRYQQALWHPHWGPLVYVIVFSMLSSIMTNYFQNTKLIMLPVLL